MSTIAAGTPIYAKRDGAVLYSDTNVASILTTVDGKVLPTVAKDKAFPFTGNALSVGGANWYEISGSFGYRTFPFLTIKTVNFVAWVNDGDFTFKIPLAITNPNNPNEDPKDDAALDDYLNTITNGDKKLTAQGELGSKNNNNLILGVVIALVLALLGYGIFKKKKAVPLKK